MRSRSMRLMSLSTRDCRAEIATGNFSWCPFMKASAIEFSISWVLVKELAVGPAPLDYCHLNQLKAEGINGILSLSSTDELPGPDDLELLDYPAHSATATQAL